MDHDCSKASIFIPCHETITAEQTALLYATYVLPHYGLPKLVISDRGTQFTAEITRELLKTVGVKQNISTSYHPQTDGQLERTNQWLEQYIRIFTNYKQDDWAAWLPLAQYMHNSWPSSTTKKAPFKLLMGHVPHIHQITHTAKVPSINDHLQCIKEAQKQAQEAIKHSQDLMTRKPTHFVPYCVGDRVWLDTKNLTTTHPTAKLAPKCYGPFLVTTAISHTSYRLKLPPQWKIHNVFHASLLTPYKETPEHGPNFPEPSLELIDGEPEWEVEQIMNTRHRRNQLQYLVRWKGFSEAHDSWEPTTHIHADHLIEVYYRQNPSTVRHLEYITPPLSPPIIIRTIMTTPTQNPIPLGDRISPSMSIPLAECLSSPPTSPLTEIATNTENNFESAVSSPPLPVIPLSDHISEPTSFPLSIETQTPSYGSAASTLSPDEAPELRELTPPTGTPITSHYSFDMADSQATSPDLVYLLGNQLPPPNLANDPHFNTPSPMSIPEIEVLHPELPIPLGYQCYDPYNATHAQYKVDIPMPGGGVKKPHYIQFNINGYSHRHTVKAKRVNADDPFGDYGTDLVAAPFWDPLPNITDDNDLNPFTPSYPDARAIDIAAAGLADLGVIADIDRYRALWIEKEELQRHEHDLRMAWD